MERSSYAAFIEVETPDGLSIYAGEAIYRPSKADPRTGEPVPTLGVPDDAMAVRPDSQVHYRIWLNGELIPVKHVYLERVATCWWFSLEKPPRHPPSV
jgi:hypothetical protein